MKKTILVWTVALAAIFLPRLSAPAAEVQLTMTGDVQLFDDEYGLWELQSAEAYLFGGPGVAPYLYISSSSYFDPDDCVFYGLNCDQCGGVDYADTVNADLESGTTYDLHVDGNPCGSGVSVFFTGLPAGYILEATPYTDGVYGPPPLTTKPFSTPCTTPPIG